MAENTASIIGVMEFGAGQAEASTHPQEEFCSEEHAACWGKEIDPRASQ
jgi:hypothetical protein